MDSVLRSAAIYLFLLILFRLLGKRTLADVTTFDFVLLLIISEATQQALLGEDFSVTNGFVVIATLVAIDRFLDWLARRNARLQRLLSDAPLILVRDGEPLQDRMRKSRVDIDDVMCAAREKQGLEQLNQVKYAVLERNGKISIVPKRA